MSALSAPRSNGPLTRLQAVAAPAPNANFLAHVLGHRADPGPIGDLARSITRDPCFPKVPASYVACVAHVNEVHGGKPDVLMILAEVQEAWQAALAPHGNPRGASVHPAGRYPPRPDICAVAEELGIHTKHGDRFCKAVCPYHPGQGEPSLVLWRDIDQFRCESPRCFVWGFSDQLLAGKFQGRHD